MERALINIALRFLAFFFIIALINELVTKHFPLLLAILTGVGFFIVLRFTRRYPYAWPAWKRYYLTLVKREVVQIQNVSVNSTIYYQPDRMDKIAFFLLRGMEFLLRYWPVSSTVILAIIITSIIHTQIAYIVALGLIGFGLYYEFKMLDPVPQGAVRVKQEAYNTFPGHAPGAGQNTGQQNYNTSNGAGGGVNQNYNPSRSVEEIFQEVDSLAGLDKAKSFLRDLQVLANAQVERKNRGLDPLKQSLHMAFIGNPGTGKTTVARLAGELLAALGLLQSGHLVEVTKKDLVAGYVGQTSQKTGEVIARAMDGVLFIDEAYDLDDNGFGKEALVEIIAAMENYRDRLVVIVAGYSDTVERLNNINPGFESRVKLVCEFPDYTANELITVAEFYAKKEKFTIHPEARAAILSHFRQVEPQMFQLGNGRYCRTVIEQATLNAIKRDPGATVLTANDLSFANKTKRSLDEIWAEINNLIGLYEVKEFLKKVESTAKANALRREQGGKTIQSSLHMCFLGDPGTGKTTVARLVGELLAAVGALPSGHLIETDKSDLEAGYVGQTSDKVKKLINKALGGVLFVDEAYSLARAGGGFGAEALDTLIKGMEDNRESLCVILAGYSKEMQDLFKMNSGLKSRIAFECTFPNYKANELMQITKLVLNKQSFSLHPDAEKALYVHYQQVEPQIGKHGNGRYCRTTIEKAIMTAVNRNPSTDIITVEDLSFERATRRTLEEIWAEINSLIGLGEVKDFLKRVESVAKANAIRRERGEKTVQSSLHMCFLGDPGTGKTTVARLVGELLAAVGALPSGHLIETDKSGLIAGYAGQTAGKVTDVLNDAMGGVLFIDEAYSLSRGGSFGNEALDTIIKSMEDNRDKLCVILAGYSKEMDDLFAMNSGLKSRIAFNCEFSNYTGAELLDIAKLITKNKGFSIDAQAQGPLLAHFRQVEGQVGKLGNGRYARQTIEAAIMSALNRDPETSCLTFQDFNLGSAGNRTIEDIWADINKLVGLGPVKDFLREVEAVAKANAQRRLQGLPVMSQSLHMCFLGNPGTGKTTVARLVGELLSAVGALPSGHLIETDRSSLVAGYVGQTAGKVQEIVDKAMGGVLFIDEAYSLARGGQNDFGGEALDAIIKAMEDHRDKLCVILAGYSREMQNLFDLNSGLESRIAFTCEFPDYTPDELVEIAHIEAQRQGFNLDRDAEQYLLTQFGSANIGTAGNGRFARKLIEAAARKATLAGRYDKILPDDLAQAG